MKSLLLAAAVGAAAAARSGDLVTSLPGWNGKLPQGAWYSGFLQTGVQESFAHYVLVQAPNAPAAPLTVWFNGGPGCSSLEGLFAENGPLWVSEDDPSQLVLNPYSWANVSSVLYIESPACVGFSYTNSPDGCNWDDNATALSNYGALVDFFAGFPELLPNPLYIAGESYAGIYVPTLTAMIVERNAAGAKPQINIEGMLVGNGCWGNDVGVCGSYSAEITVDVPFYWGHSLIPATTWSAFTAACTDVENPSAQCQAVINQAHQQVADVNIYDIYAPCINDDVSTDKGATAAMRRLHGGQAKRLLQLQRARGLRNGLTGPDECIDGGALSAYMNRADVMKALHVPASLAGSWAVCTKNASFAYTPTQADERQVIYPTILDGGVRVLIYSGDVDACVPFIDSEYWTASMNRTIVEPWRQWMVESQNAGYVIGYEGNFTFVTVKGAGHMVPEFRPEPALIMFQSFVKNAPLPSA